jgi:thioredoxin-related protein
MNAIRNALAGLVLLAVLNAAAAAAGTGVVAWRSLDAALTEAEAVGKPVMIHFTAEWCGWCKKMKREVYAQGDVAAALNEEFVPAMVDTDRRPDLKARYGVRGLPTIWFLTSEGHGITYIPGYVEAPVFRRVLRWITSDAYQDQSFEDFSAAEE